MNEDLCRRLADAEEARKDYRDMIYRNCSYAIQAIVDGKIDHAMAMLYGADERRGMANVAVLMTMADPWVQRIVERALVGRVELKDSDQSRAYLLRMSARAGGAL